MHLTAVVCTHNRYELLKEAISSLVAQDITTGFDIIIVDNSQSCGRASEFAAVYKEIDILRFVYEAKPGLSNARNLGVRAARGDIVAYMDDDALASPAWARALREAFVAFGTNVAVVGGPVEPLWCKRPPKWISRRSLDMLSAIDRGPLARELEPHEWLAGCNIAFRREMLLETGGFPTSLGRVGDDILLLSNEEQVVCERLMAVGKKVAYTPAARVLHRIASHRASPRWIVKRMAWQAISDAVSHPSRSIRHAEWKNEMPTSSYARALKIFRFFWIMSGFKRSLSDEELEIVYDTFNAYICQKARPTPDA